ncbi:MAG TPA: NAD-binding protein [Candidatus Limnocylindria bacterium]|nr:NAD-binding protein [Candidatus Limnocylindria bacterium]
MAVKKSVLLVGGRSKAQALALSLLKRGYQVTAVNDSYDECVKLSEIDGLSVVQGDGTKPYVLEDAEAGNADIVIALTSKDEDNLVACELCKKRFGVRKAVSLLMDPRKTDFFYRMGVDSVVCAVSAVAGIIEQQAFVDEMANVIPLGEGRVQIAEVPVTGASPVAGKKLWEVALPPEVIIGCVLRGEKTIIPRGDTRILAGDTLVVISGGGQEVQAIRELAGR